MAAETFLGFDVGTKLIGVAIGSSLTGSARPLTTLSVCERGLDWSKIEALLKEWQPAALVVGLPLSLDGGEQAMTRTAMKCADELAQRSGLNVHRIDERNSSREASQRFAKRRAEGSVRRKHAASIDAVAATVILDRWFDQQPQSTSS